MSEQIKDKLIAQAKLIDRLEKYSPQQVLQALDDYDTRQQPADAELVEQTENIIDLLRKLPKDCMGESSFQAGTDDQYEYPIRDKVIDDLCKLRKAIAALSAKQDGVEADPAPMLINDNKALRSAGDNLAVAALRVTHDYDGIHRLNLAIAGWTKAVADEGGRGERHGQALSGEGEM